MDVHTFSYLARRGLDSYVSPILRQLELDVAWVIEARGDEEMPEQIQCAVQLLNLDYSTAPFLSSVSNVFK